ncbi:MAG: haloacid dehalogenase type II [Vulcanimicrobiaceae bacterium]
MDGVTTLMFDFYGTVVDMQSGLAEAITPFLKEKKYEGKSGQLVTWWRRTHFENSMIDALVHKEHTPYREIGFQALDYTLERAGVAHTDDDVRKLVDAITRLKPFADVPAALERLRTKYKLVILSNGDRDMLASGVPYSGIEFDRVISVAESGSFKPHVATYRKAAELIGAKPSEVLFVANHAFDCLGAKAFGMRAAFIDRRKRPFGKTPYQPDLIVADFAELAQTLL